MAQGNTTEGGFEVVVDDNLPRYSGIDTIMLIMEDDPAQRQTLENIAKEKLTRFPSTSLCVASDTAQAIKHLENYRMFSPQAWLNAILDYNFSEVSAGGDKKPADALFYSDAFRHFLNNKGGVAVIYSGSYVSQAQQSQVISEAIFKCPNFALFFAQKAKVAADDVIKFMLSVAEPKNIHQLRSAAEKFGYDLGGYINAAREQRKQ
ncbi:hypothetical protein HZC30_05775 [Candidatus Woesearchaeota archaeon]|nr:hypothetical protein [Candidatus Woesearchaeota archaeon]